MTKLLTGTKCKPKKVFSIIDKDHIVKIKQPSIMEIAFLYAVLLENQKKLLKIDPITEEINRSNDFEN